MSRLLALALFVSVAPPTRWVTDESGAMSPKARAAVDQRLEAYERNTGHQIVVFIAPSTGGEPIEDWSARTFREWRIGRAGLDDGVAVFVFTKDRAARIEVGYGLEDVLPDALSARILRRVLIPQMAAGDVDAAISQTVDALTQTIGGPGQPPPAQVRPVKIAFVVVAVILFIALAIWQPQLAWLLLMTLLGRRNNGRGGGGGGFSGGGGRSGGAGASGRW